MNDAKYGLQSRRETPGQRDVALTLDGRLTNVGFVPATQAARASACNPP